MGERTVAPPSDEPIYLKDGNGSNYLGYRKPGWYFVDDVGFVVGPYTDMETATARMEAYFQEEP